MRWLEPADCLAAQDCLEQGNALEAARLLLDSPAREHRAARKLLLTISERLAEQAADVYEQGDVIVAAEMIECAAECAKLSGKAEAMRAEIARRRDELEKRQGWCQKRLERARRWAEHNQIRSAISVLRPLTDKGEAQRLRVDLEEKLARLQRYVRQCHQCIQARDLVKAKERFGKARKISPDDPEVVLVGKALDGAAQADSEAERLLRQKELARAGSIVLATVVEPVRHRYQSFAVADKALVVSSHEVVIGNPLGDSVHIPIQSRIHRRHALLIRDRRDYFLLPYTGCPVLVHKKSVKGPRKLADGDIIQFEIPQCRWRFRRPVADSTTAVLEQVASDGASVRTPGGKRFDRIVLMDDRLEIRAEQPAHIVLPDLPCDGLSFRWSPEGVTVDATGGTVTIGDAKQGARQSSSLLQLPCQLAVNTHVDEAALLACMVLRGDDLPSGTHVNVYNPF